MRTPPREKFHPIRAAAIARYNAALSDQRAAENLNPSAYYQANDALTFARRDLIAAEEAHPTTAERKAEARKLSARNRGLDT